MVLFDSLAYNNVRVLRPVSMQPGKNICLLYPDQCPRSLELLKKTAALKKITDALLELRSDNAPTESYADETTP